jgi:hypothetical protein
VIRVEVNRGPTCQPGARTRTNPSDAATGWTRSLTVSLHAP